MNHPTGRYVEVKGRTTYYETSGQGVPMLLIHTAGRDCRQWHGMMKHLGSQFQMFAPDLPGHGKSWPLLDNRCHQDIVEIADWLRDFMSAVGAERFVVMGCSVGGNLSLLMGSRCPEVTALVALQGCAHTPSFSEAGLDLMTHPQISLMHANMDFTMSLVGRKALPEARAFTEWGVLTLNAPAQQGDLRAYARCDIRDLMKDVRIPVLLLRGEDDWLVSQDMIEDTRRRLVNAPDCRLVTVTGIGHFPHLEDPEQIARIALRFLEEVGIINV